MKQYFFNFVIFISKILIDGNVLCFDKFFFEFFFFSKKIFWAKLDPREELVM